MVDLVVPSGWAGGGLGVPMKEKEASLTQETSMEPVAFAHDMTVADALRVLLSSNAICCSTGSEEVFYVKMQQLYSKDMAEQSGHVPAAQVGGGLFCVSLGDLLEAPRQMPIKCLLGTEEDSEECVLYENVREPYLERGLGTELMGRLPWLVGLLSFLTVSSAILEYYDALLQRHLVIAFYLTVLVGCGGNAGSQASSLVLQALATGEVVPSVTDVWRVLRKELLVALSIAAVLSIGVFGRIALFSGDVPDGITIACAMFLTVLFSVVFGSLAPLGLQRVGIDPAKVSGPLLSTVIDIAGVVLACICAELLESFGFLG